MNQVQIEDCRNIGNLDFIDWEGLKNTTILITGSTGLIGSNLVNALAYNSQENGYGIRIILPTRNVEAAQKLFGWTRADIVHYELGTTLPITEKVDYVVHLASPTDSKFFSEKPVDTLLTNFMGYEHILNWAKSNPTKKFVGVSSMEVYGFPEKGHKVSEQDLGTFDPMNSRNSYPIAKLASEALCYAYYKQHGVPTVMLRATQTFGPGVKYHDSRVFAQFMRCVIESRNIVLKTAGQTERSYLYTADAVSAILVAMLEASPGHAYSIANPDSFCSIVEMANLVADEIAKGRIRVELDVHEDIEALGYAKTLHMDLDVKEFQQIGWEPKVELKSMYERMIRGIIEDGYSSSNDEYI